MKYSNSLKYMNGFLPVLSGADISQKRVATLCLSLGRINLGLRTICMPSSGAGHALAVMLEAVMKNAGHKVGRITSAFGFDSRASVYICGEIASIEDYNSAVEELKGAVKRNPDMMFTREETTFVLGLLLCRMTGCEYVIFEGLSTSDYSLDAICAPYELIVIPALYGGSCVACDIKCLCDTIKRETREVVSSNQKSEVYNTISNACAMSGARLSIPVKAQFEVEEVSSRNMSFSYVGREGFSLKNPSYMLRDVAITVIEAALALRRGGVRIPWSSIIAGLSSASNTCCFDVLSLSPKLILDSSTVAEEAALLFKTANELWGEGVLNNATVCVSASALGTLEALKEDISDSILVVGRDISDLPDSARVPETVKTAAKEIYSDIRSGRDVVCFGDVGFICELKSELLKLMNA